MHGSGANEQLLAEYPLVDFLLQTLNVAEVEDVILKYVYLFEIRLQQLYYCLC